MILFGGPLLETVVSRLEYRFLSNTDRHSDLAEHCREGAYQTEDVSPPRLAALGMGKTGEVGSLVVQRALNLDFAAFVHWRRLAEKGVYVDG